MRTTLIKLISILLLSICGFTQVHDHSNNLNGGNISTTAVASANKTGSGTKFVTGTGSYLNGHTLVIDSGGNVVDATNLSVAQGGTGRVTFTIHALIVGNTTGPFGMVSVGSTDQVLMGVTSSDPAFVSVSNCHDSTHALAYDTTAHAFSCQLIAVGTGTVSTTGSPASGNLTKFSGATTLTNGDLSGDVTTSSTLATTVAKIQGVTVSGVTGTGNAVLSASPAFTGTPTAPTQASNDNSTNIATTAWVNSFTVPTSALPTWLSTNVDAPPTSAGTLDDEFDSGSISGSWTNLGGTASVVNGTVGDSDTVNVLYLVRTQPATPWEVQGKCLHTFPVSGFGAACALFVRDSAGGKLAMCEYQSANNFNTQNVLWAFFTNLTTFSSNNVTASTPREPYVYFKLKNTGTNLECSYSWDGIDWINIVSQAKGTFVPTGGDQVGLSVGTGTATTGGSRFAWFRRTL